jgi:hypothetical protein
VLWLFKIFAVPALVGLATLAVRRWGARVGGLLMGLPLMTGPVSLFLAIDQGTAFAARATIAILLAVAAVGPWALAFHRLAPRYGWLMCLAGSMAVFLGISLILQSLAFGVMQAGLLAFVSILGALLLMPREPVSRASPAPWWDIWCRMLLTAALVVAVTVLADQLGPRMSGMLASLPIVSGVVVCFTRQRDGAGLARAVLRGLMTAMLSFVAFFVTVGEMIEPWGIGAAYLAALALTLPLGWAIALLEPRLPLGRAPPAAITKALE